MSEESKAKVDAWQTEAAKVPIQWAGDLSDDCTARWAGLTLRAEEMRHANWWWAVYDDRTGEILDTSAAGETRVVNGHRARIAAEISARRWIGCE
jgi:hypothetical protein